MVSKLRRVLVGHRGVGKSALLQRHGVYFPQIKHFDLDLEIEKYVEMPITEFFTKKGESTFREVENLVYNKITQANSDYVIALGGGFNLDNVLPHDEIIFVTRVTDADGRIFLNRPRLEQNMGPLAEYEKRFNERESKFQTKSHFKYRMPEGIESEDEAERKILSFQFHIIDAYHTLRAPEIRGLEKLIKQYAKIELRNDLLTSEQIETVLSQYPEHHWLVSIRNTNKVRADRVQNLDCDVNFISGYSPTVISSHENSVLLGIQQLQQAAGVSKVHLKLCPLVENFEDLKAGYEWQQQDSERRSFLPRSPDGRWLWYRQLCKYLQNINFVKSSHEIADQPSLYEWLSMPLDRPKEWSAVLGLPVYFSRSPQQHKKYFEQQKTYFTKIELSPDELSQNILFLNSLGLRYAAVTSPLKEVLYRIADIKSEAAEKFRSANTLLITDKLISVHNTDLEGFCDLVADIKPTESVAIWGGGGTLEMMKSVLPSAFLFSSQTAELRDKNSHERLKNLNESLDYFIWAAPRTTQTRFPSETLKIKQIIDLNYTAASMGLELAALRNIPYTSGLKMFRLQALKQQQYWSEMTKG